MKVDLTRYRSGLTARNVAGRIAWGCVSGALFRLSPRRLFGWRRFLLRCFGARIGKGVHVYPSARIWAPWNLQMGDYSCLSFDTDCYCVDRIAIGAHATISQYAFLCSASHDLSDPQMALVTAPICIGPGAWVCARAYIGPGVTISSGAVVAACAVVVKDVGEWMIVGGNPARVIGRRGTGEGA